jgi:hypothetical protein
MTLKLNYNIATISNSKICLPPILSLLTGVGSVINFGFEHSLFSDQNFGYSEDIITFTQPVALHCMGTRGSCYI